VSNFKAFESQEVRDVAHLQKQLDEVKDASGLTAVKGQALGDQLVRLQAELNSLSSRTNMDMMQRALKDDLKILANSLSDYATKEMLKR
jgi:hypothetical protein